MIFENRLDYLENDTNFNDNEKELIKYGIQRVQYLVLIETKIDRSKYLPHDFPGYLEYLDKIKMPEKIPKKENDDSILSHITSFFCSIGSYFSSNSKNDSYLNFHKEST